jgi:hypothetical protein
LTVGQIDVVDNIKVAEKFNITSYPNIFLFRDGQLVSVYPQSAPRTVTLLVRWIEDASIHKPLVLWGFNSIRHKTDGQPDAHPGEVWTSNLLQEGQTFQQVQAQQDLDGPSIDIGDQAAIELLDDNNSFLKQINTSIPTSVLILLLILAAFVALGVSMVYLPKQYLSQLCGRRGFSSERYESIPTSSNDSC